MLDRIDYELFLEITNYIGTIAFAASGALKGMKYKLDIFGITLLAIITACGGGIIRDMILTEIPSALLNPESLYISIATSIFIYFSTLKVRKTQRLSIRKKRKIQKIFIVSNLIFDSIGLSIFALIGANKGINLELNMITVGILAALTGVGGGIIRDLLVREIPNVLKEDIYAVLAFVIGICYYILVIKFEYHKIPIAIILFTICLMTRLIVIRYKVNLPTFKNKL